MGRAPAIGLLAMALAILSGCSDRGLQDAESISASDYYSAMKIGEFAQKSPEDLDRIGKGLCGDLAKMDARERKLAVLVIRESTDTELDAFKAGEAMTSRWCPEYKAAFAH